MNTYDDNESRKRSDRIILIYNWTRAVLLVLFFILLYIGLSRAA